MHIVFYFFYQIAKVFSPEFPSAHNYSSLSLQEINFL